MSGPQAGTKATVTALAANIGIATSKVVAFVFTGSASMLAEGIHSLADTTNQMLLLVGMRSARREPDEEHPFGHGRDRYFWSFIVAVVLFSIGGVASAMEGLNKFRHPHEVGSLGWAFAVLGVATILEAFSLRTAMQESAHLKTSTWWSFIRDAKVPELPVLLLEDTGALVGLVLALGGITLSAVTGDARYDAGGSIAIGLLLCAIAVILGVELRSLLLGESASPEVIATIRGAMSEDADLVEVIHVRTQHIGPDQLLVGAKVRLRDELTFVGVVDAINRIEMRVRERVPSATVMYVEPDVTGSPT